MSETNPTAPGGQTSEGRMAKYIQVACAVLLVAAGALTTLQERFPGVVWLQVAATGVAGIVSLFTQLGLLKSRTLIKTAMIAADVPRAGPS